MSVKIEQITKKIIHLKFKTQERLASAFLRFQEHYESPEWRGKVFTVGQYLEWYARENGAATYTRDWDGFNIPSYVLEPFIKGLFDPLTEDEQEVVDLFRYRADRFYVIGTSEDSAADAIEHEVCHGLYHTSPEYRTAVNTQLDHYDLRPLLRFLKKKGYCEEVLPDEAHAYISASGDYLDDEGVEYDEALQRNLKSLYKAFLKKEK